MVVKENLRDKPVPVPSAAPVTTATVAAALGRPCVTIDVSPATCRSVADRVEAGAVRVERPAPEFGNPTDLVRESCGTSSGILPNRATLLEESSRESLSLGTGDTYGGH